LGEVGAIVTESGIPRRERERNQKKTGWWFYTPVI